MTLIFLWLSDLIQNILLNETAYAAAIRRTVYCDDFYRNVKRGISLGCPLSPLMGALYLKQLDDSMDKTGLFYVRFMDDCARWMPLFKPVRVRHRELTVDPISTSTGVIG